MSLRPSLSLARSASSSPATASRRPLMAVSCARVRVYVEGRGGWVGGQAGGRGCASRQVLHAWGEAARGTGAARGAGVDAPRRYSPLPSLLAPPAHLLVSLCHTRAQRAALRLKRVQPRREARRLGRRGLLGALEALLELARALLLGRAEALVRQLELQTEMREWAPAAVCG